VIHRQLAAIIKRRWPGQPGILATAFAADFHPGIVNQPVAWTAYSKNRLA